MLPTTHLVPGVVEAYSAPVSHPRPGRPAGVTTLLTVAAFAGPAVSEARPDIMRWKYAKFRERAGGAVRALRY
jgi:hypothetical protein